MDKILLTVVLLGTQLLTFSQTTKYFEDRSLQNETTQEKAKYSLTTRHLEDGRTLSEVKQLRENIILSLEDNNHEPFGIWSIETGNGRKQLNYDFELNYGDTICNGDSLDPRIWDPFADNNAVGYVAPKLSTGEKFIEYLWTNLNYPAYASDNGISGTVILSFTVTKDGTIENIAIKKSVHVSLDREAVRLMRKIKFISPPKLNGQERSFCATMPVIFMQ